MVIHLIRARAFLITSSPETACTEPSSSSSALRLASRSQSDRSSSSDGDSRLNTNRWTSWARSSFGRWSASSSIFWRSIDENPSFAFHSILARMGKCCHGLAFCMINMTNLAVVEAEDSVALAPWIPVQGRNDGYRGFCRQGNVAQLLSAGLLGMAMPSLQEKRVAIVVAGHGCPAYGVCGCGV